MYKNFDELIYKVKNYRAKKVAVAAAHDFNTLEAVFKAKRENIIEPVLIGDKEVIYEILNTIDAEPDDESIIDISSNTAAAEKAVELINEKKADFIMKGKLQTSDLLKAVVDKEKGLNSGNLMSHVALYEIPSYHKLLAITDGGINIDPSMEQKKLILENAVKTFHALGYDEPKVAVLTAAETVNPKMKETVDAYSLKNMNLQGGIKNCMVEGPISYDLAMSKKSAKIKGFDSPITGEVDILVVPTIAVGNVLGKALSYSVGAKMAGFVVGATVPVVLTSRGSDTEEKYLSLVLSAAAAN